MNPLNQKLQASTAALRKLAPRPPSLAFILGSGFHPLAERVHSARAVPYSELPGFPRPTVPGHAGKLLIGRLGNCPVLVLCGRAHYYEGHSPETITSTVRALASLGIRDLLLTNAAGGINPKFRPGDFMRVTDHINMMGFNPLRPSSEGQIPGTKASVSAGDKPAYSVTTPSTAFPDLSQAYDPALQKLLTTAARRNRIQLRSGVYLAVSGPSYETPAEIRAFKALGADAVGMSTVPEVIVARQCGLRVAALSCITNLAAGLGAGSLSHDEVLGMAAQVGSRGADLLETFATEYHASQQP